MPFYIRKSISAGPFRFNLSKGGVGLSVGIRGLRLGTGPRGHYVHAGRGGLYYRSSIGRAGQKAEGRSHPSPVPTSPGQSEFYHPRVNMVEVESGDVLEMADSRFLDILNDLNGRADLFKMAHALGGAGLAIWFLGVIAVGFGGAASLLLLAAIGWGVGAYLDSYRRASVVYYEVEGEAFRSYQELIQAFDNLARCGGRWHVAAGGAVQDMHTWKTNAGASHLVSKSPTQLDYKLPSVLKSNITPPSIGIGKQTLFLLPDVALVEHGGRFGAIAYGDLSIHHQLSRFIEEGPVPGDAEVVGQTWRYVNKNGGPDRRFNDNRQIPVVLYEAMHLKSASGLNELVEFSKTGVVVPFGSAVANLASCLGREPESEAQKLPSRAV